MRQDDESLTMHTSQSVWFLLTDIEGSTFLWEEHPNDMALALRRHDELVEKTVGEHGGRLVKARGEGDSTFSVFFDSREAVAAAVALQLTLQAELWPDGAPLSVRAALHGGSAEFREGDYYGPDVNRCARLRAIGHGGQTLISETIRRSVSEALPTRVSVRDLGLHRLRDLTRPEHVFQLDHPGLPGDFPALRSLDSLPHNLPVQLTSFVGREREVEEGRALVAANRVVTLTGTGGVGKTRLALQIAAEVIDEYPDGVWFTDLSTLTEAHLVPDQLAHALGIRQQPGRTLLETLLDYLGHKTLLLVLDNCEHLIAACAELVEALSSTAPDIAFLTTSRELLGIRGEFVWHIPSLQAPPEGLLSIEELMTYSGVQLFSERAALSNSSFVLTPGNAEWVAVICRRLDGIPLAIELAAARTRMLSPREIVVRLEDRFRLLAGGFRGSFPRQQTLSAAIDWSFDLLAEDERRVFRRLSVFAGSFDLDAAEIVCGDPGDDLGGLLSQLIDKSLVQAHVTEDQARYAMLETIRSYAQDKLVSADEENSLHSRHVDYFLELAEESSEKLQGPDQVLWLDRLEIDHDNLRQALEWAGAHHKEAEALRLASSILPFWQTRGYLEEGRARLRAALEGTKEPRDVHARALRGAGVLAMNQGDYIEAATRLQESLLVCRELGDEFGAAAALHNLGLMSNSQGDYAAAERFGEEALATFRRLGNERGVASSLTLLSGIAFREGDDSRALSLHEEILSIRRKVGDQS